METGGGPGSGDRLVSAFTRVLHGLHRRRPDWLLEKLTMPQFRVLTMVVRAHRAAENGRGCPPTPSGLAKTLDLAAPTMTGIVDRLTEAGFVERKRTSTDRRVIDVVPTDRGRAFVADVFAAGEERLRTLFGRLSPGDAQALLQGLEALNRVMEAEKEPGSPSREDMS